jgi:hypothetical protein
MFGLELWFHHSPSKLMREYLRGEHALGPTEVFRAKRKGRDRGVTQLIATLSARYHSSSSEQAAVPRGEAA